MVLDDLNLIIRDIRAAHKKDSESCLLYTSKTKFSFDFQLIFLLVLGA